MDFGPMFGVDFDFGGNNEMKLRIKGSVFLLASFFAMASMLAPYAHAQQTLGGITGTVTDASGAVVADATVTLVGLFYTVSPYVARRECRTPGWDRSEFRFGQRTHLGEWPA